MNNKLQTTNVYNQAFSVHFEYKVIFTENVFSLPNKSLAELLDRPEFATGKALVFLDEGLISHWPQLPEAIETHFGSFRHLHLSAPPAPVPGGENVKNDYRLIMKIVDMLLEYQMCRHSFVVAIGGGAVLDAVGFAAAIVHRGIRTVRLPTTVLGQNDAGVGVKNGMNLHGIKNAVGTFLPPFAVINDCMFLRTLPDVHWRGGIAEALKVALIKDLPFFEHIERHADELKVRNMEQMQILVRKCAELHLDHIRSNGDPFEAGSARPLDFGHWAAHYLETMSRHRISHGEAVAVGMAIDLYYACRKGWISRVEMDRVYQTILTCGLELWYPELEQLDSDGKPLILRGLEEFREHLGGKLCVTFPRSLGQRMEVQEIDHDLMTEAVRFLQKNYKTEHARK